MALEMADFANEFVQQMTPVLGPHLLIALLCLLFALVISVLLVIRKRVPAVATALLIAPLVLISLWNTWSALGRLHAPEAPKEQVESALFAAIGNEMFSIFFVALPAFVLAVAAAVASLRGNPKKWRVSALAALVGGVAAGGCVLVGWFNAPDHVMWAALRSLFYAGVFLPMSLAFVGWGVEEHGRAEAAAGASLSFVWLVAVGEVSGRAQLAFFGLPMFLSTPAEERLDFVQYYEAWVLDPMVPGAWLAILAAMAVGILGLVGAVRSASGASKWVWLALGSVWLALAPVYYLVSGVGTDAWNVASGVAAESDPTPQGGGDSFESPGGEGAETGKSEPNEGGSPRTEEDKSMEPPDQKNTQESEDP